MPARFLATALVVQNAAPGYGLVLAAFDFVALHFVALFLIHAAAHVVLAAAVRVGVHVEVMRGRHGRERGRGRVPDLEAAGDEESGEDEHDGDGDDARDDQKGFCGLVQVGSPCEHNLLVKTCYRISMHLLICPVRQPLLLIEVQNYKCTYHARFL